MVVAGANGGGAAKVHLINDDDAEESTLTRHEETYSLHNTLVVWKCVLCGRDNPGLNETCKTCGQKKGFQPTSSATKAWKKARKRKPKQYKPPTLKEELAAWCTPCFGIGKIEGLLISKSSPEKVLDTQAKACCLSLVSCPCAGPCWMTARRQRRLDNQYDFHLGINVPPSAELLKEEHREFYRPPSATFLSGLYPFCCYGSVLATNRRRVEVSLGLVG